LANIDLQGAQMELVKLVASVGKPMVATFLAGRPVTFEKIEPMLDAILYAWHPGTMAGPALTNLLFGVVSPSGKLPVTFPRHVGQIPIYYSHKRTGKPATNETWERINDIPFEPMYPFGFGLSYSSFQISEVNIKDSKLSVGDKLIVSAQVTNNGNFEAAEVVQVYTHQLVGSRTRPVKELRAFQKVLLAPGDTIEVSIAINTNDLGFHNPAMEYVVEPGQYHIWVGNSSQNGTKLSFEIIN
jgi:beta-glucosidase